jgi:hypothetical protein
MGWSQPPANVVSLVPGASVGLATGAQLTMGSGLSLQSVGDQLLSGDLGTGGDGAVVISSNTTLAREFDYSALTVNTGIVLTNGGNLIRCTGTVAGTGIIDDSGTAATSGGPGVGGASGTLGGGAPGVASSTNNNASEVAGLSPSPADVEGGQGANATAFGDSFGHTSLGGTVTQAAALGGSVSGLRSLRYTGGASGAVEAETSSGGPFTSWGTAFSSGAGGVAMVVCDTFNGPTVRANGGGTPFISAIGGSMPTQGVAVGGAGGGCAYVFCRHYLSGSVQARGGPGATATKGTPAGTQVGGPGAAGRAAIVASS